ncbi:DoxX family membrane protein [Streptomyces sp. NBC_01465]|uniref:DoxX family membrane protein n=1 Tax=Streptomyces sp. NBC_01465 TaxID=2903878 RepID=UPI002E348302|nr:DoxX family membrane protein [Streptomyces sp. NBC_01465]
MSVDTRTPRFDEQPALSMVKVDCDPAQVIVNHASFRVQLAPKSPSLADTARIPAMSSAGGRRRAAPVVWSGKSAPGDPGASGLLQAVRNSSVGEPRYETYDDAHDAGATQVIPRISLDEGEAPAVVGPRSPYGSGPDATTLLPRMREAVGAYDHQEPYGHDEFDDGVEGPSETTGTHRAAHAFYPDRRMNLGVVLLPLRVFLGLISVYAGMGKLCDPVYFDGGERGSMVKWLNSLHPWALAEPLRDFALSHPVGAGLTVAFLQVVVGVLTVLGLWQRVAGVFGALLSAALLVTVSWRTAAYDAPDVIYLAAWSPLIIAGAPVYSLDSRLAGEAWRTLGPRSELWQLRRRVLRRGTLVASLVVGLTLLIGSVLGAAVRSSTVVTVPGPNTDPTNHLPGLTLPEDSAGSHSPARREGSSKKPSPSATGSASPKAKHTAPAATAGATASSGTTGSPSQTQGSGTAPTHHQAPPPPAASSSGPSSSGGSSSTGGSSDGGSTSSGGSSSGGNQNPIGGLLG